eukprot:TRINITY_DN7476_c0_g2_i2.p1 TRINITY_DN7476_c0_g2~~TRINITY_DN7476_c0_g2_i2.p1  ORF type:complete len:178 (-),score=15.23 TRINITY_DN7476_c0_g2_i2:224-757(-)
MCIRDRYGEGGLVLCLIPNCGKKLKFSSSTTSMRAHIARYHKPKVVDDERGLGILKYCIRRQLPLSHCSTDDFKQLLQLFGATYSPPCPQTMNKLLDSYFEVAKTQVIAKLCNEANYPFCTLDLWTSTSNNQYLGITIHYIDDDFKAWNLALEFVEMSQAHTALNIKEILTVSIKYL